MRSPAISLCVLLALTACDDDDGAEPAASAEAAEASEAAAETEPAPEAPTGEPPEGAPTAPSEARQERAAAVDVAALQQHRRALARARRALRRGDQAEAVREYREAVRLEHDGRALCELGWVYFQAEQMSEAREAMERALMVMPADPVPERFANGVGACLYNAGRLEEAEGHLERARARYTRSLRVRPGNPTVAQRLAGLPAAPAPSDAMACASGGEGLAFDEAAWTARVQRSETRNAALEELGLDAIDDSLLENPWGGSGEPEPMTCRVVTTRARFAEGAGRVIDVTCGEADVGADRVAVLLERPGERVCVAGRVAVEIDYCSTSCLGDQGRLAISSVPLVAENVDALRFDTHGGACACGAERGATSTSTFYGVESGRLVEYLRVDTLEAWYTSPTPPMSTQEAEIRLGADYPRAITVVGRVLCDEDGCDEDTYQARQAAIEDEDDEERSWQLEDELREECGPEPNTCEPSETTTRYTYANGAYTAE